VTAEEFMDLIDQMRLAVFEEAMLFELPAGSIDDPGGLNVIHGPWATEHCSTVLMCWLNLGWVALYRPRIPAEWAVPPGEPESRADPRPHASRTNATQGHCSLTLLCGRWNGPMGSCA
jgi:hypothetical protein